MAHVPRLGQRAATAPGVCRAYDESGARSMRARGRAERGPMARKKRRKRRAHGVRGAAAPRSKARQSPLALAGPVQRSPDRRQSAARLSVGDDTATPGSSRPQREGAAMAGTPGPISLPAAPHPGLLGRVPTVLLPGRVFFAMGRPVPGIVCCVLQASLLGWVPAALWATRAKRHLTANSVASRRAYGRSEGRPTFAPEPPVSRRVQFVTCQGSDPAEASSQRSPEHKAGRGCYRR
jgi:hypothetical protein